MSRPAVLVPVPLTAVRLMRALGSWFRDAGLVLLALSDPPGLIEATTDDRRGAAASLGGYL